MNKTKTLFIAAMALCIIIYLTYGNETVVGAAVMLLTYVIAAKAAVSMAGRKLEVGLSGEASAEKGSSIPVLISLNNRSLIPVAICLVNIDSRNMLTGESRSITIKSSIGGRCSSMEKIKISDERCGKEELRLKNILISDALGMFTRSIHTELKSQLIFLPSVEKISIADDQLNSYDMESYKYSQRRKGEDMGEVFGIRDYRDGDSPKMIHWKLSAKMDDIVVRMPSYPIENNIVVLFDNSPAPDTALSPDQKSRMMDLFFSVSHTLVEKNIAHSLGWYDTAKKKFELVHVDDSNDMWKAMTDALGAGFSSGHVSTPCRYIEALDREYFSSYFIVTASDVRDVEKLEKYGAVRIFRCR